MSKGSRQRPRHVDQKTFDSNWDRIFNSNKVKNEKEKESKSNAYQNRKAKT
jgi:hypothetical protein